METEVLSGMWQGKIDGTNTGAIEVDIAVTPVALIAHLYLEEPGAPGVILLGTGEDLGSVAEFMLSPRDPEQQLRFGIVSVRMEVDDGTLIGVWRTTVGTSGTFRAARPNADFTPDVPETPLSTAKAHEKNARVRSCVVDLDTLERLYAALHIGAEEAARLHHARERAEPARSYEDVLRLYRVTISVRGAHGELMLTEDSSVLAGSALPKPLRSIDLQIGLAYQLHTNSQAPNRAHLTLDFSKPHAFDFSAPSGTPTRNVSNINVYGSDPIWVAGVYERLTAILQQNAVRTGWLHRAHTYDVLLALVGLPFVLSIAVLVASRMPAPAAAEPPIFTIAVFIFTVIITLSAFRLAFSLTRWLLPYIEFSIAPEPLYRKLRVLATTLLFGVIASLAATALWQVLVS